jgi:hypothetical protein
VLGGDICFQAVSQFAGREGIHVWSIQRDHSKYLSRIRCHAEVRHAVTDGSRHELLRELSRIRDEPVPQEELEESSRSIVANFASSLEQTEELLEDWLTVEYYGLPTNYWDRYPDEVGKVTAKKIQQVGRKYVDLDHLQIVCVGDGKQIRDVLQNIVRARLSRLPRYEQRAARLQLSSDARLSKNGNRPIVMATTSTRFSADRPSPLPQTVQGRLQRSDHQFTLTDSGGTAIKWSVIVQS